VRAGRPGAAVVLELNAGRQIRIIIKVLKADPLGNDAVNCRSMQDTKNFAG
jgi:hypothetical protein